jgi:hypothetical protein
MFQVTLPAVREIRVGIRVAELQLQFRAVLLSILNVGTGKGKAGRRRIAVHPFGTLSVRSRTPVCSAG